MTWPTAELDRVQRLRVLAAGLPGSVLREYRVDAPFERAWEVIGDLERSVPQYDGQVTGLRVVERSADGTRLHVRATSRWNGRRGLPFDVDLTEGWCWMVARPQVYVVGMAAEPDGDSTRMAHLEGIPLPAPRLLRKVLRPALVAGGHLHRRHVDGDVARIIQLIEAGPPPT